MTARKTVHFSANFLWVLSAGFLLYSYSLHTGYWKWPLYCSLALFFLILVSGKLFTKRNFWISFFYLAFVLWVLLDFFLIMSDVLGNA